MAGSGESGQYVNFGDGDTSRLTPLRIIEDMGDGMTLQDAVEYTMRSGEIPDLVEVLRFIMLESGAAIAPGGTLHYAATCLLARTLEQSSLWDTAREADMEHLDPREGHNAMMQRAELAEELRAYAQQLGRPRGTNVSISQLLMAEEA